VKFKKYIPTKKQLKRSFIFGFGIFLIYFIFCLPSTLFNQPYSKLLVDKDGQLLEARIAADEQWRFPIIDSVPKKFETCILRFEDKNFRRHPGVNPLAIGRAVYLNIKYNEVVSGASTITMQTIRLLRANKNRSIKEKLIEMTWAMRLECSYSKNEILNLYATHAPFGGNVVGLETASWRYFNRSPNELSWAENAMLAVLPNAPGLIHLNKNRDVLRAKRNKLLKDMWENEELTEGEYKVASSEPLPKPLNRLPHHAFHLVDRFEESSGRIRSTIDFSFQKQFNNLCDNYSGQMKQQNIHNLSAVLIDVKTGKVLSYVGNIYKDNDEHAGKVDMLKSVRSSGSILKPLLYAAAVSDGLITPNQLVPDYPMNFYGYRPSNYNPQFDGLVPADEALFRSLNIPAAWLLSSYGVTKMKNSFAQVGLTSINRPASNYGLSMILGGAEVNLLELTASYAALGNQLTDSSSDIFTSKLVNDDRIESSSQTILDNGSVYTTLSALTNTYRPETEAYWKNFSSGRKVAWKTGTSFGNRDAWAVGVTPDYAVGAWIGNSDGHGVSGLTGLNNAAPLLFELFGVLPETKWFYEPYDMQTNTVCKNSGMKASSFCTDTEERVFPLSSDKTPNCIYHNPYLLNPNNERIYKGCNSSPTHLDTFFIIPPIVAHYYQKNHPDYKPMPSWSKNCVGSFAKINILYPINGGRISMPQGEQEGISSKVFYENSDFELHWELNGMYLGSTSMIHEKILYPTKGKNTLHITDENGNVVKTVFEVI
jgi:penicillin-binding protein 1C